jgi:diguanylate cyclase
VESQRNTLSLLYMDIDFFKRVNDTYGHGNGDLVLQQVAFLIRSGSRNDDIVSRNGGEEFTVLMKGCPAKTALAIAERMRSVVEGHYFELSDGINIQITMSIGVAVYPDTTRDLGRLAEQADKALYRAKALGRNKVVIADPETAGPAAPREAPGSKVSESDS